jgi:hypothetical protein
MPNRQSDVPASSQTLNRAVPSYLHNDHEGIVAEGFVHFFARVSARQRFRHRQTAATTAKPASSLDARLHLFTHSNYSAVLLERDLVHQRSHEMKSAAVTQEQSFWRGRVSD